MENAKHVQQYTVGKADGNVLLYYVCNDKNIIHKILSNTYTFDDLINYEDYGIYCSSIYKFSFGMTKLTNINNVFLISTNVNNTGYMPLFACDYDKSVDVYIDNIDNPRIYILLNNKIKFVKHYIVTY